MVNIKCFCLILYDELHAKTIFYFIVKPFIIRGPQNQTAISGSSAVFQCRVGGEPLPDVLWRRSAAGGNMPLGRVHILEDRSLRIDDITIDDMGEYICEADNAAGSVISSGILTVQCNTT